jgi:leader peptidase (prepilin peptidase)/N-methyltransferase
VGIVGIYLFVIGCCVGSFINVICFRLPLGKSIIYPSSRCAKCNYKLKWFDNIPLISWILLGAKCRSCKKNISITYPLIELITGLIFCANFFAYPSIYNQLPKLLIIFSGIIFSAILIVLTILDCKYFWLPKKITFGGLTLGLIFSLIVDLFHNFSHFSFFINSIVAAFIGFIFFYLLSLLGLKIYKKPVMGDGDAKLSALLGSWLGIQGLFITIWMAFFSASIFVIFGLILKKIKRKQKIPFGAFLSLSGLIVWQFGNQLFMRLIFFNI